MKLENHIGGYNCTAPIVSAIYNPQSLLSISLPPPGEGTRNEPTSCTVGCTKITEASNRYCFAEVTTVGSTTNSGGEQIAYALG